MTSIRLISLALILMSGSPALGRTTAPFDEETLDRIQELNRAIADHYERLESTATELEARRAIAMTRVEAAAEELAVLERERSPILRLPEEEREAALRALEERRIDAKSRSLEALAEKHAIDLEAIRSFEDHASAILRNLERLGDALEESGRLSDSSEEVARAALHSVQRGTAIALATLEEWGELTREDPRFRALWATARVLNRNAQHLRAPEGLRLTLDLVRERTFVVRSLVDQARAMGGALDQQGLLLQVAAQNQMLRLHFVRLGAISGMELPDLRIADSMRRIIEDIEEEPFGESGSDSEGDLDGFEDCLNYDHCN
jgi:hypothetical protein